MPERYTAMRARAAVFDGTANWVTGIMVLGALWYGFLIIVMTAMSVWMSLPAVATNPDLIDTFFLGATPATVCWNLATFGVYTGILWVALRLIHGRGFADLLGPAFSAWIQFRQVCLYLLPLFVIVFVPSITEPNVYQNLSLGRWLIWLPLTLPLLFVQISAEELVFRGYLQSHLAALSRHPLVWMLIPSVLFGLIHYDGTQPAYSAWAYVVWATALGLVTADLTARSGTLGPALAVHLVNNLFAMLVLSSDTWLYGAALFIWPTNGQPWEPWIPFDALFLFTVWIAARLAIRR